MRCVFDTNVLVSAFIFSASKPRKALDLASMHGSVLVSDACVHELVEVLQRPRLRRYLSEVDAERAVRALTDTAELINVTQRIQLCRDPKDDKFLELAVDGRATHIVTGDLDLLALNPFHEIRILAPHTFLDNET